MIATRSSTMLSGSYSRDKFVRINILFGFLANFSLWLFLGWQVRNFSDSIPLHYNIYFGIDLLGPWYRIFLLPALGLAFLILNSLLGTLVYKTEKILSYFLIGSSSFVQLILIIAASFIILINY